MGKRPEKRGLGGKEGGQQRSQGHTRGRKKKKERALEERKVLRTLTRKE